MIKSTVRALATLVAVSAAVACSTNRSYMSSGDVDVSTAVPAQLGVTEITMLRQMSDANILGHLIALDSMEVTLSDTALRYIRTDRVNEYARMMHLAHNDDWKALRDIARGSGLIPTIDVTRLRSSHVAAGTDSVRKGSDMTKDQQFIRAQIALHQHALAELQVLEGVARNAALREHIVEMMPTIRQHLAHAMAIGKPMGVR